MWQGIFSFCDCGSDEFSSIIEVRDLQFLVPGELIIAFSAFGSSLC